MKPSERIEARGELAIELAPLWKKILIFPCVDLYSNAMEYETRRILDEMDSRLKALEAPVHNSIVDNEVK